MKKMLEVCIDSLESALGAIHGGADEIEVCSCLEVGGLTPSVGLVMEILNSVQNISTGKVVHKTCIKDCKCLNLVEKPKINIMIRCHGGGDFIYSQLEMDTMLADVTFFKTLRVDRFVFGALDRDCSIDALNCKRVIDVIGETPITFHRAFDVCSDQPTKAVEKIISLGFDRLLTSGQCDKLSDPNSIVVLKDLIETYGDKIQIMPGSGLSPKNAKSLIDLGCSIVHGSCKGSNNLCDSKCVELVQRVINS